MQKIKAWLRQTSVCCRERLLRLMQMRNATSQRYIRPSETVRSSVQGTTWVNAKGQFIYTDMSVWFRQVASVSRKPGGLLCVLRCIRNIVSLGRISGQQWLCFSYFECRLSPLGWTDSSTSLPLARTFSVYLPVVFPRPTEGYERSYFNFGWYFPPFCLRLVKLGLSLLETSEAN